VPAIRPLIEAIQDAGIYLGEQLVAQALQLVDESYPT